MGSRTCAAGSSWFSRCSARRLVTGSPGRAITPSTIECVTRMRETSAIPASDSRSATSGRWLGGRAMVSKKTPKENANASSKKASP